MFKKVLQSISKSLHRQQAPAAKPEAKRQDLIGKVAVTPAGKAKPGSAEPASNAPQSPEELCGITPKMNKEQVREQLKLLYRRFNRAASSLDPKTRSEADTMLDAIVIVREKHFGQI